MRTLVGAVPAQCLSEAAVIIDEYLGIACSARNGDERHSAIDQIFDGKICIDVDQDAICSLPLSRIAGDSIAVIGMRMALGIDAQFSPGIKPKCDCPAVVRWP
jgi:hypothetical protein